MSIVVTCACTMEYRLPDRYAGKRCRCRECGGRIRVPREGRSSSEDRKKKRKRAKAAKAAKAEARDKRRRKQKASTTTRRMGATDRDILSARRALRSSSQKPVSESMHQLAPLLSGDRLERHVGLTRRAGTRARNRSRERQAERARRRKSEQRTVKKARKVKRERPGTEETQAIRSRRPRTAERAKPSTAERGKKRAPERGKKRAPERGKLIRPERKGSSKAKVKAPQRKKGRATPEGRRRPARKTTRAYGRRSGGDDDGDAPRSKKTSPTRAALYAVIVIAGVLCLGIGLVVGTTVFMAQGVVSKEVDTRLDRIQELKDARQWDAAKTEADELEVLLTQLDDESGLSKLYASRAGIDKMIAISQIEDDESKLGNLLSFAADKDPAVRNGVVWELRPIAPGIEEAQQCLAVLAKDSDPKVAEAAKQALVQAGGRHSVPYLAEAIQSAGSTGSKQGDVALQRALEVDDPSIAPVLVKILEVRPKAPVETLRQVLERLGEYGNADCLPVVERFTKHEDAEVAEIAQAVVEELKQ